MTEEITYQELSALFDIPSTSWNRAVNLGKVPKLRRGVFDREMALAYCEKNFRKRKKDQLAIDWLTESDLGSLYDLERAAYGRDVANPNLIASFLDYNPFLCKIAFNSSHRGEIWGAVRFLPVRSGATLMKLIELGTVGAGLGVGEDGLVNYASAGVYDLYVASIIMKEGKESLLTTLLIAYFDWWVEQYPDRRVGKIWARSVSHEGGQAAITLGMSPFYILDGGTLSRVENAFVLDLSLPHHNRLVRNFQTKLQEKMRTERGIV
jgi:hypothetical protein